VYIRDDRRDQDYFGLCEVEVFAHRGTYVCLLFQYICRLCSSIMRSAAAKERLCNQAATL
jgi:hypothetical protein